MHLLFSALLVALMLGGCTDKVAPLSIEQRARFVAELLEEGANCNVLRKRLAASSIEPSEIDAIYRDAKKSACLKRDV
jgi:hypothetical protein